MYGELKKNRGGQLGNQNARSHGYYSNRLPVLPRPEFINVAAIQGVDSEITLVRLKLRQILEKDPDNISAVIQATNGLCRLLRLRSKIAGLLDNG